jgi:uncharacterized protein with HEPN domain
MHSDAVKFALYDIRDNILLAQEFVQGLSFDEFSASRLYFYATSRAIQIISEASRRLPDDVGTRHPNCLGAQSATPAMSIGIATTT